MKLSTSIFTAIAGLALAAPASFAAVTYNPGDLLLGFRATGGTGVGTSVVIDIGQASSFRDATGSFVLSVGDLNSIMTTTFGANWQTRTDISWGVAGSGGGVGIDTGTVLYASKAEVGGVPGVGFSIASPANRSATATRMNNMTAAFSTSYNPIAGSTQIELQGDNDTSSWRSFEPGGPNAQSNLSFGNFNPTIEGDVTQSLSLFRLNSASAGSYEGSFSLGPNGAITFAAVPEPASAALAGLGAVMFVFRRRRAVNA